MISNELCLLSRRQRVMVKGDEAEGVVTGVRGEHSSCSGNWLCKADVDEKVLCDKRSLEDMTPGE